MFSWRIYIISKYPILDLSLAEVNPPKIIQGDAIVYSVWQML